MTVNLPSELKLNQFDKHKGDNWSNSHSQMNSEDYNEFTKHMNDKNQLNLSKF
jgi:hypothetical protein